jgi:protein tyrosine/serine phosphatase
MNLHQLRLVLRPLCVTQAATSRQTANACALEASFKEMHAEFGSIDDYFAKGLGIDESGQQALRDRFDENK